jgi:raffinose/stachyose/melibiose transport system substrate-binding protein
MRLLKCLALVAAALTLTAGNAVAQTTVRWLHIEANPAQVKIWEEVARAFEAKNPGVKIEMQFLENESYKAKLPTILQSKDRPHIIYSWAGGVLKAQIEAGVLEDISAPMKGYSDSLAPAAVAAFTQDGKIYGVPMVLSQATFLYNKELMAKAGVDGAAIKTWDDLLAATRKLKAAGVTPIAVGGADKWPLHFYWTYPRCAPAASPLRCGAARETAASPARRSSRPRAVQAAHRLAPFQTGFLGFKNQPAWVIFRRRQGRHDARPHNVFCSSACWQPTRLVSATTSLAGLPSPPSPAARAMPATRWAASPAGW